LIEVRGARRRASVVLAGSALVPGTVALGIYLTVAAWVGPYAGVWDMSGWHLYSRVAPFADCSALAIVKEHPQYARLCPAQSPDERLGPYYYEWVPQSPAQTLWGLDPGRDATLRRFALEVIRRQPGDYLKAIGTDVVRVFDPGFDTRDGFGQQMKVYSFDYRDRSVEGDLRTSYSEAYTGTMVVIRRGVQLLSGYQRVTRLPGVLLLLTLLGAVIGLIATRRTQRRQVLFILLVGLVVLLGPIVLFTWDFRYTLAACPLLVLAGVVGIRGVIRRTPPTERISDPRLEHLARR
jgi:hypothetical protein